MDNVNFRIYTNKASHRSLFLDALPLIPRHIIRVSSLFSFPVIGVTITFYMENVIQEYYQKKGRYVDLDQVNPESLSLVPVSHVPFNGHIGIRLVYV
jgi:hypothetical protein